jgi:hypothetical protein
MPLRTPARAHNLHLSTYIPPHLSPLPFLTLLVALNNTHDDTQDREKAAVIIAGHRWS